MTETFTKAGRRADWGGGIFLLLGLGVFVFLVVPALIDAARMQDWSTTSAEVLHAELERQRGSRSVSYRAVARYRYQVGGVVYEHDRVGISTSADNLGDWHRDWARRLERAQRRKHPIAIWYDPDDPQEAVIDRRPRWGLLASATGICFLFAGVGGFLTWIGRRRERAVSGPSGPIASDARSRLLVTWALTLVLGAISVPLVLLVPKIIREEAWPVLAGLILPLVALMLLVSALRQTLGWLRFGGVELRLDPDPGAVGGDVGGFILLRLGFRPERRFQVSLSCTRSYVDPDSHKHRQRHALVWQRDGWAAAERAGGNRTRLRFRFEVPEGLPPSGGSGDDRHVWQLHLRARLPGADLDRLYQIPVMPGAARASSLTHLPEAGLAGEPDLSSRVVEIRSQPDRLELYYPAGRHPVAALVLTAIGMGMGAGAWFMGSTALSEGGLVAAVMLVIALFFAPVGLLLALLGLYMPFNTLAVTVTPQGVAFTRRWLGIPLRRQTLAREEIQALVLHRGMEASRASGSPTVWYDIRAQRRHGKPETVGESLEGTHRAEWVGRKMAALLNLPAPRG